KRRDSLTIQAKAMLFGSTHRSTIILQKVHFLYYTMGAKVSKLHNAPVCVSCIRVWMLYFLYC
ncbi:MAG: hypothetical protein AAGJ35_14020, partial [Myxococcota bacterium]